MDVDRGRQQQAEWVSFLSFISRLSGETHRFVRMRRQSAVFGRACVEEGLRPGSDHPFAIAQVEMWVVSKRIPRTLEHAQKSDAI